MIPCIFHSHEQSLNNYFKMFMGNLKILFSHTFLSHYNEHSLKSLTEIVDNIEGEFENLILSLDG